jgi:hypothetical protein
MEFRASVIWPIDRHPAPACTRGLRSRDAVEVMAIWDDVGLE